MTTQIGGDGVSIVVAFTNVRADQDYVADAVTYLVAKDLARLRDLSVISAETTYTYKAKDIDASDMAQKVAQELKVSHFLTGRVEKFDANVRAEVGLIDAAGNEVWGEAFDLEIFDLPVRVTNGIAAQFHMHDFIPATQYSPKTPGSVTAVKLWMQGVALLLQGWTPRLTLKAEELFSQERSRTPIFLLFGLFFLSFLKPYI